MKNEALIDLGRYKLRQTWMGNWTVYKEVAGTRPWETTSKWVRCKTIEDWQGVFKSINDLANTRL